MSNQLEQLLEIWYQDKDEFQWVLATVIETAGSSYRKPGAMTFINDLGKYYGLISGGCLESDLMRQARECFTGQHSKTVCYDMREDDELGWQLGIGCGGMVKLLLQPITTKNNFLDLLQLRQNLSDRIPTQYCQIIEPNISSGFVLADKTLPKAEHVIHDLSPAPLFAILGGGVDARPLCKMAHTLGWHVIVIDERIGHARAAYFPEAKKVIKQNFYSIVNEPWFSQLNAITIMTHNVELDGKALKVAQLSNADFIGLLGPKHRTERVLKSQNLTYECLTKPLSNPIGLNIGGELPESIALSILAEAHGVLEGKLSLDDPVEWQHVG